MSKHKKIFKKVEVKKVEVKKEIPKEVIKKPAQETGDESNLIITKDLDKFSRLLKTYKLKEIRVDEINGTKTYVFYKN